MNRDGKWDDKSSFESLQIGEELRKTLRENGIVQPSSIQMRAIPEMLAGKDVIAQSQTGTGKTLAYLLPVLQTIVAAEKELQAIIIIPTRELGMQILREAEKYGSALGIRSQALIGGAAIGRQIDRLRQHPHVVVGTPGRLVELIKQRRLKVHGVRTIVIDEADHLLELGSMSDVEFVLRSALRDRQIVFFSATIPEAIQQLAKRWVNDAVDIQIEPSQRVAEKVEHSYFICDERDKIDTLRRLVRHDNPKSALVFVNEIDQVGELLAKLRYIGLSVDALYGDSSKQERATVLDQFRRGKFQLLIATEVAARGLDIEGLTHVINFDPPLDAERYVHRIGRTGRMGRSGIAISIITPKQEFIIAKFAKSLGIEIAQKLLYAGEVVDQRDGRDERGERSERDRRGRHDGRSGRGELEERDMRGVMFPRNRTGATGIINNTEIGKAGGTRNAMQEKGSGMKMPGQPNRSVKTAKRVNEGKNKGAPKWLKEKRDRER